MRRTVLLLAVLAAPIAFIPVPNETDVTHRADLERSEIIASFDPVLTVPAGSRFAPANVVVNDPTGESVGLTQSEVGIWVSGDEVVIGWNDGIYFDGGESATGVGYSNDRGATWTDVGASPGGEVIPRGDPAVVRTNAGTWIVCSLNEGVGGGNLLQRAVSPGGSFSFTDHVIQSGPTTSTDRENLDYDVVEDRVYLAYKGSGGVFVTYSTDDGLTWAPAKFLDDDGISAYPVAGIDGEVYVSWSRDGAGGTKALWIDYSPDGGVTFPGAPTLVRTTTEWADDQPQCFNRPSNPVHLSCDVDRSDSPFRGRIYATWTDGAAADQDIYFSHSDDKGATWSLPVTLNDDETTKDQFWPHMRVSDTDGRVLVAWFDRRKDMLDEGLTDLYVTMSRAGGESFVLNRRASDMSVSWCGVPANLTPNFGDYIDVDIDGTSSFIAFADARLGDPDVVFSRIDDRQGLDVTFAGNASGFSATGTAWLIPNDGQLVVSPAPVLHNDVEAHILATALAMLATPQEADGVFTAGGESFTGAFQVISSLGFMNVTMSLSRLSAGTIALDVQATSDEGYAALEIPSEYPSRFKLLGSDNGVVDIDGATTLITPQGVIILRILGSFSLDNEPTTLLLDTWEHDFTVTTATGSDLVIETRSIVTLEPSTVDAPVPTPPTASTNPFPQVTVRAAPNPLVSGTAIHYSTERETEGAVRIYAVSGRLVRTLAERRFEVGEGSIPFDGRDDAGMRLGPGAYYVRFETDAIDVGAKLLVVE